MTGLPTNLADRADRIRAVTCFDANLVVEAGAGTGKTSLLVERILITLGIGYAGIDEITAITFTEKAAAEMRTRLATGLERLLQLFLDGEDSVDTGSEAVRAYSHLVGGGIDPVEVQERLLAALNRIDRAQVITIHTFCAGLLRAHPVEAGVDPSFNIDKGEHYDRIREEEWERFVVAELADGGARTAHWQKLLRKIELDDLRDVAFELAGFLVPREILEHPRNKVDPLALFGGEAKTLLTTARSLLKRQAPVSGKGKPPMAAEVLAALHGALEVLDTEGYERFLQHVASSRELQYRLGQSSIYSPANAKGFEGVDVEEIRGLIRDGIELLGLLASSDDETAATIVKITAPFASKARERLLQQGFVGFEGLLTLARDLLRDHPVIRESVRRGIRMLLVDEFQDTDPVQYEIVFYLAEKAGESARDPYAANLEPGRLFVVGDPKQSIYRFRGADYSAFRKAVTNIADRDGIRLTLETNFRAVKEILKPVNRLFGEAPDNPWRPSEQHQPPYIPLEPTKEKGVDDNRLEVWNTDPETALSAIARRTLEAGEIATEIEKSVAGPHARSYGDIMILVRAFSNLEIYLRALRDRRIPYIVDGGKGFMERSEVTQLIGTARAAALPGDQAALLSYLRSPAGGINDVQLADYAAAAGTWDWRTADKMDAGAFPAIYEAFTQLADMAGEIRDQPADMAIRTIVRLSGMEVTGALAFEGSQRVANIRKLCAVASELARDGRLSLVELLDLLKDEKFTESESESPMADEKTDAVRILSIHKAKGLESNIIIVPDLARGSTHHPPPKLEVARLPDGSYAASVRMPGLRNLVSYYRERNENTHDEAESIRLLYVALTRAKQRLIVVSGRSERKAPWVEAIAPWKSENQDIYHYEMKGQQGRKSDEAEIAIRDTSVLVDRFQDAANTLHKKVMVPFRAPSAHDEERFNAHEDPDALPRTGGTDRDEAKALGTAVHQALENWAPEAGPPTSSHLEASEMLKTFNTGDLGKRFRKIEIKGREVPMLLKDDGGFTWRGSIDLLYEDNGTLVVADYKTDVELTDDRRENYGKQLKRYAEAVAKATGKDVRTELWMVRTGKIVPL